MFRSTLLAASRSQRLRNGLEKFGPTRSVVQRFVGGPDIEHVVQVVRSLSARNLLSTVDHLGEDVTDDRGADATLSAYLALLESLRGVNSADVSVKLTALGLKHSPDGALQRARTIVNAASSMGATVTIDMESSSRTDATLATVRELRRDEPSVAAVLQAMLRRTESDARALGAEGARVRLCKGAYAEDRSVAFHHREDVRSSYVRSLTLLWESVGTPLVATHDPVLIDAARQLAMNKERTFVFQMLYGVRPDEQDRLVKLGHRVRIYVPYGDEWYGYLVRRLAERPANDKFFLRSISSKS